MNKNPILNIKRSPIDERDWVAETIYPKLKLEEELDLTLDLLPIRDQGDQGTCAAQTAACMKEWQEKFDIDFNEYMSPQFIYNNREEPHEPGMYPRDVMKILYKIGSVAEVFYPYWSMKPYDTEELVNEAKKHIIENYARIYSIDGLKSALQKNGPCFLAVPVYNFGPRMWKPNPGEFELGGHAMAVVGYNKDGFIIRNSWGIDWGDNGYCIFPYEDWGLQYEVWTTIDSNSKIQPDPPQPEPDKESKSLWDVIVSIFKFLFGWIFK